MPRRSIAKHWKKYWTLPHAQRLLLAEAVMALLAARIALIVLPFPTIVARLGVSTTTEAGYFPRAKSLPDQQQLEIQTVSWAVTRAARHVPFRAVCLPQAIAGKRMLRRRGIVSALHFGVATHTGGTLEAHAWLDASGIDVTGFPVSDKFTEIACFV